MAEEKGFEPLRRFPDLPVFKTGPFNQTWVFLQKSKMGAPGRSRTGTGFNTRGILSPLRLPIPPLKQHLFYKNGDPLEIRTPDPLIKSQVLYRLS